MCRQCALYWSKNLLISEDLTQYLYLISFVGIWCRVGNESFSMIEKYQLWLKVHLFFPNHVIIVFIGDEVIGYDDLQSMELKVSENLINTFLKSSKLD